MTPSAARPPSARADTSTAVGATSPRTPLFSARRVPALVQGLAIRPALHERLDAVLAESPERTCLRVDSSGRNLYASSETLPLIPASNQKVVTAQLALDVLGSDHRYRTEVGGDLGDDGVVGGDLYLVGGGDPVLRTRAYTRYLGAAAGKGTSLEALADAVVAAGVRHVIGSVVGDESRYDSARGVPGWPDDRYLAQHQLGPLSALEVDQSFTSFPEEYSEETLGSLVSADDPPAFAARTFAELLEARGVRIDGGARSGRRAEGTELITGISSPPLTEIVAQMLNRSDNQIAELLVKEAGFVERHEGTTAAGLAVFTDAFPRLGVPSRGVELHDGSGLGYDNRSTCALLATLLDRLGAESVVAKGLAVAGRTGTLRERFTGADLAGRIRAKTGTLDEVTSLSGFASPGGAPRLVFAFIANGAPVTPELLEVQEDLGRALLEVGASVPLRVLEPR